MKQRILRICLIFIAVIAGGTAISLLLSPKLRDYTSSIDTISIQQNNHTVTITDAKQVDQIITSLNDAKLKQNSSKDYFFSDKDINVKCMNGNEELIFITITSDSKTPYIAIVSGKTYVIKEPLSSFKKIVLAALKNKQ